MNYQTSAYEIDDLFSSTQTTSKKWRSMTKTDKKKQLDTYANALRKKHELSVENYERLLHYLHECLDEKKLQKSSDIEYDEINQQITGIPRLMFKKSECRFTLKHYDNKNKTVKRKPNKLIKTRNEDIPGYDISIDA